jgi:hypothetical protein
MIWMAAWSAAPVPRIVQPMPLWFPPAWDALLISFKPGSKEQNLGRVQAAAAVSGMAYKYNRKVVWDTDNNCLLELRKIQAPINK